MQETERQIIMLTMATGVFAIACIPAIAYVRERHTLKTWIRGTARIQLTFVEKHQTISGAMTDSRSARYVFRTPDGKLHEGMGRVNGQPGVGEEVEVRYRPDAPTKNSIYTIPKIAWYILGIPWTVIFLAFAGVCLSDALLSTMSN
ncbi:DUF3592 domain-containing protein [Nocardioides sp. NPDC047086]|uniref:DUF3592 domain-containing protein n=1 Tax=Nocardioides sp. NPDC047086 TaxID=3154810 RepID=UPI0033FBC72A